jgi:hypothetical protein
MTQTAEESPGRGSPPNTTSLNVILPNDWQAKLDAARRDPASVRVMGPGWPADLQAEIRKHWDAKRLKDAERAAREQERIKEADERDRAEQQAAHAALAEKLAEEERKRTVAATARRAEKFADSLGVYRKVKTDPERPPYKPDETPVDPDTLEGRDLDLWKQLDRDDRAYFGYFKWINDQRAGTQQFTSPASKPSDIRSKLMKLSDLESMAPARPLIKGVLDLDSESWLIGQPGGFKSFIAVDWACHVASGAAYWRGRKVTAGDVIYIAAEGARGFAKRVKAWSQKHEMTADRLQIYPAPVQARGETNRVLSADWLELIDVAREIKPVLIVLDTQARMTVGLEENSATDMGLWVQAVDELKAASGACVLVVHHTGRNGGDARGSSAIDAAQDMEWKVERKAHQLQATLRCEKSKDGDDRARFVFAMELITVGVDEDSEPITSLVPGDEVDMGLSGQQGIGVLDSIAAEGESLTNQEWILRTLGVSEPAGDGVTQAELMRLVNGARKLAQPSVEAMNANTYKSTIKRMLDAGQVFKRGQRVSLTDPADDADDAE